MPVPQLPLELVALVLDYLFLSYPPGKPWSRPLSDKDFKLRYRIGTQLAQVCKTWSSAVDAALWREVELDLDSPLSAELARRVVKDAERILPRIRHLRTTSQQAERWPQDPDAALALATILTRCTRLETIEFDHNCMEIELDGEHRRLGDVLALSPSRESLSSVRLNIVAPVTDIVHLVHQIPLLRNLKSLMLVVFVQHADPSLPPPSAPSSRLTGLRKLVLSSFAPAPPALLSALPTVVEPTLTSLTLEPDFSIPFWKWAAASPRLRTVRLATTAFASLVLPHLHLLPPTVYTFEVYVADHTLELAHETAPDPVPVSAVLAAIPPTARFALDLADPYLVTAPEWPKMEEKKIPHVEERTEDDGNGQQVIDCRLALPDGSKTPMTFWREMRDGKVVGEWLLDPSVYENDQ
ncbi:hypothetical protein JCM8097_000287 [Rhodosporidiobolus ruineniae]